MLGVEALRRVHICSPVEFGFFSLTITANFFRDATASASVQGGPAEGRSQNYEELDLACHWGSYFNAIVEN